MSTRPEIVSDLEARVSPAQTLGGMIAAATAIFVAALLATGFAWLLRIIDCNEDTQSVCSTHGRTQLGLALVGLAVSFGTLVASVRGGPRPESGYSRRP